MAKKVKKIIGFPEVRFLILPALLLGLILISFNLLVWPKVEEIQSLWQVSKGAEERLARLTEKVAALEALEEKELLDRSEMLLKALPEDKQPMLVIITLGQVARQAGVSLSGIEVSPGRIATEAAQPKEKDQTPFLTYEMEISGSLDQIDAFMEGLEKMTPLARLTEISLQGKGGGVYTSKIEVDSYYSFLPISLGKIDAPLATLSEKEKDAYRRILEFNYSAPASTEPIPLPVDFPGKTNPFL